MGTVQEVNTYWGLVRISMEENNNFYGLDKRYKLNCINPEFPRACFYYTHPTLESALNALKEEHSKFVETVKKRIAESEI